MKTCWILVFLAALLVACSKDTFPKYVALGDLRILAIKVSAPEVNPGATVTLTPYLSDIGGDGNLQYSWQACVDPGVGLGAEPTCDGNSTATSVTSGTINTLNSANTYTATANTFAVTVPSTILVGRATVDSYNGVNYIVLYSVTNSTGTTVKSFKRIVVSLSSKTSKNSNPSLSQILSSGVAVSTLAAGTEYTLIPSFLSGAETYDYLNDNGNSVSATETLQTTWFYSDGEVKYYRTLSTEENKYKTPDSFSSTRSSFIVVISRDDRGGIDFKKVVINP